MKAPLFLLLFILWPAGTVTPWDSPPRQKMAYHMRHPITSTPILHRGQTRGPLKDQGTLISLAQLLKHPNDYHQKIIRLRGTVTRLELHLDDTQHFIDFVFFLEDDQQRVLVFGRHDRTQGDIQLTSDRMVEVQGLFWKERFANGHRFENHVEAQQVRFYPPLTSDQA